MEFYTRIHIYRLKKVKLYHAKKLQFADEMLERFPCFYNTLFSDEVHFRLNCSYLSDTSPLMKHQKPAHSAKVTVWAALSVTEIIGPHFHEIQRSRPFTVYTERYIGMLEIFFTPALHGSSKFNQGTWSQQDRATCHPPATVREIFGQKKLTSLLKN